MENKQIKLIIGSLLHDIGKVIYRAGDGRQHSTCGSEFLKETCPDFDKDILDCVRYHHAANLKNAKLKNDALAYITYFADNVASAMDRREGMESEDGFDRSVPLDSVFNILNGNNGNKHYKQKMMDSKDGINFPTDMRCPMDESFYNGVVDRIKDNLKGIEVNEEYINSLLSVLEATLSFIPSSTSKRELADISLYDHVKMTAAVAECCYQYMKESNIDNYHDFLFKDDDKQLWRKKMFLLYSIDISGIQNFIYTLGSKGALRGLRARSFYLEMIMEHIVDELLYVLNLSRACLIYVGGGHCYMLLPNTKSTREKINDQCRIVNEWFMKYFDISLYLADGFAECCANDLKNEPYGSYREMFHTVTKNISLKKSSRYDAKEIAALNKRGNEEKEECQVCRRAAVLNNDKKCHTCAALEKLSGDILYQDYFIILSKEDNDGCLPLPGGKYLMAGDKDKLLRLMNDNSYVRSYTVNELYIGKHVTTKIWIGRYTTGDTFESLAQKAEGINRIAILRADIDNLGNAFAKGFSETGNGKYETLSRMSTLSRQLSLFFKYHINSILENGKSSFLSHAGSRQISVVYSGGDDLFIVGSWNQVVDCFVDIKSAFEKFAEGTLTVSGGIGIYDASFPINRMAAEVAELEDYSKQNDGKNAVTIFDEDGRYDWNAFIEEVLKEKYDEIRNYMSITENRGKSFLYHILELLRESEVPFNRARFVYYLSRMEPDRKDEKGKEEYRVYQDFSRKMYQWSMKKEDRRQTVTAIYLYVYMNRDKEKEK